MLAYFFQGVYTKRNCTFEKLPFPPLRPNRNVVYDQGGVVFTVAHL